VGVRVPEAPHPSAVRALFRLRKHRLPRIVTATALGDPRAGYAFWVARYAPRSAGKRITSRIVSRPERSIASRSIPSPRPAVGGIP